MCVFPAVFTRHGRILGRGGRSCGGEGFGAGRKGGGGK